LEGSTIRVLVVDDYEPFRRFLCARLGERQDIQVIGEASDGLSAIRKAEELQPDLIVLDIGLPALNGIEVGRRIRRLCPDCKILFVSQESFVEVVQEAFKLGASAYVVKAHAGTELSAAMEAICQGRRFVSKRLLSLNRAEDTDTQTTGHFFPHEGFPPVRPGTPKIAHHHRVNFYSHDAAWLVGLARFVEAALNEGNPVIVVATEPHRDGLFRHCWRMA
jgi:DNA-binding NarL/FixJ family response regulator